MKAVLLGTGWRARFFMRISRLFPSVLDIVSIYTHTKGRAEEIRAEGYPATSDLESALSTPHEAVIVASGKTGFFDVLRYLHSRGERIISETTFLSLEDEELAAVEGYGGLVMEQYSFTPLLASALSSIPLLPRGFCRHRSQTCCGRTDGMCQRQRKPARGARTSSFWPFLQWNRHHHNRCRQQ